MKGRIICADCIKAMRDLEPNSVDALCTDPPYGLGFLDRSWDSFSNWPEFMRFNYRWGKQANKILKPGAHAFAFGSNTNYDLLVVGLRLANYDIKDMWSWMYGSTIGLGLDIAEEIDKYLGKAHLREEIGQNPNARETHKGKDSTFGGIGYKQYKYKPLTKPYSDEAKKWEGWRTHVKSLHEPIVLVQKPIEKNYAHNVHKYGVGGLNFNGNWVQYKEGKETDERIGTDAEWHGTRSPSKHTLSLPAVKGMKMYKKNGRWPSNVLLSPIGAMLLDRQSGDRGCSGRANLIGRMYENSRWFEASLGGVFTPENQYFDSGGASRYFKIINTDGFFYSGKAYKTERNAGCHNLHWRKRKKGFKLISERRYSSLPEKERAIGNPIATLKPINLMRYLLRMIVPPNGTVVDPFGGSGTTAIAAIIEGFNYIIIEKREAFAKKIIPKRIEFWSDPDNWEPLKNHNALPPIEGLQDQTQNQSIEEWL